MNVFPRSAALALAVLIALVAPGCQEKKSERPATVSTVEKEKHTKTKAHQRDKKKEKEKEKANGGKKPAKPTPAKPA